MPDYVIRLDGLEVSMGLGIHEVERTAPQRVIIDVAMTCRYSSPPADRIDDVVDYDFLREQIRALAASRHFALQEVLCDAVAALALADARVIEVRVRSTKPDIYPDASIGCETIRRREGARH